MKRPSAPRPSVWLLALVLLAITLIAPFFTPGAQAQNYSFSVPSMQMEVFVNTDSSGRIVYAITFANADTAAPIDIVDIGTPHDDYDISNMRASVDGTPVTDIRPSTYIDTGVEIHLGSQAIGRGEEGTLRVEFTMPDLVYGDTTRADYASLQITPTWFDSSLVRGTTNLEIAIHLPAYVAEDEVLFQDVPFTNRALFNDRQVVVWQVSDWRATGPYRVGVSFPDSGMTGVIRLNAFQLAVEWLRDNDFARIGLTVGFLVLFAVLFLRFTGNTGWVLMLILGGLMWCVLSNSPGILLLSFLPLPLLFFFNERHLRRRKAAYLPAIAQVEGGGIKRGLSAAEAAVILELPLNKVLTLVIFGMLKKGMLRQTSADPLTVEITEEFQTDDSQTIRERAASRRKAAQQQGVVIHTYENPFLDVIAANPGKPLHDLDFGAAMKSLIQHAANRVKNFDLSDTQDYYRSIIKRALQQASEIGDIEQRTQTIDRNLEWVLMNDRYDDVFTPRQRRFSYVPIWIRSGSGGSSSGGGLNLPSGTEGAFGGTTSFGDVAASFAGWTENTMGGLADAISPGSVQAVKPDGGVINLSGVDRATGDFFEALSSSSGSGGGGGGGGGCACACAGCACACACAGGGR